MWCGAIALGSEAALPNDDTAGVGEDDYARWASNFGNSIPGGGGAANSAAVPEPSVWLSGRDGIDVIGRFEWCGLRWRWMAIDERVSDGEREEQKSEHGLVCIDS